MKMPVKFAFLLKIFEIFLKSLKNKNQTDTEMCSTITGHFVSTDRKRATPAPVSQGRDRAGGRCPERSYSQG